MEGLGSKLVVGAPTLVPLQFQTCRKKHGAQAHPPFLTIPRSPITHFTLRSSLHPTHSAGQSQGQQLIKSIVSNQRDYFSAINPQKLVALIRTLYSAGSKPHPSIAPIQGNPFLASNPQKSIARIQRTPVSASNTQEGNNNVINPNSNPVEKLKKIARAGLLVITISVLSLNVQGTFFCRPAMAAWYWPLRWPYRKAKKVSKIQKVKANKKFWSSKKVPIEYKQKVLEKILHKNPNNCGALKGLLITRMRDGDIDSAIEILDTLMFKEPLVLEWRLVKAQIQDYAGRLEEAKEGFEYYLAISDLCPRALQGLAMVMHKLGEDAAMVEMLEERLQRAQTRQLEIESFNIKLLLAHAYILQDNLEEALKQYQCLVDENPKDFRPYLCQGIIYSVLGKKDEAEERFEKYRNLVPKHFPRQDFLDNVMTKAKTEGRKRYEERKKEEDLLAQGKTPMKPMKQPNIGGALQDLAENESAIDGEIRDLSESESSMGRDIQDLLESERKG